jgi:hypothetical protein
MSSKVAVAWHLQSTTPQNVRSYSRSYRLTLQVLKAVGSFVKKFLEVEPIFIERV